MKKFLNKIWYIIPLILSIIIFFGYSITITHDSSHYLWLTDLISSNGDFSNWDIARGIIFPLFVFLFNVLFGRGQIALLVGYYLLYVLMIGICYLIYKDIVKNNIPKWVKIFIVTLFVVFIILNPILFGYYHTLLTEGFAITFSIIGCYISWKYIYINPEKQIKKYIIYTVIFGFLSAFMWNLKQPYVGTIIYPLIVAIIISIIKKSSMKNVCLKILTFIVAIISIVLSIFLWNFILKINDVKVNENRSSSSFFSRQLLEGVSCYNREFREEFYTKESIENNNRILNEDKQKIYNIINKKDEEYLKLMQGIVYTNKPE